MKKIICILLSLIIIYFICDKIRIDKIKYNNYNEIVITTNNVKLYKKIKNKYTVIGEIKKNTKLYLEKTNYKNDYYKLLEENYYIKYENIKKEKGKKEEIKYNPFNKELITTDKFVIDNIKINEQKKFKIYLKKKNNYIKFNNQLFQIENKYIKKEKNIKINNYTDSIVILNLINYNEEQLKYLSNYKMIDNNTYIMWKNKEIELLDNTILLVSEKQDELFKKYNLLVNKIEFEINENNEVSKRDEINSYEVDNINLETLKKMLKKETIIINKALSVPVLNYHFFYDEKTEKCNETICLDISKFEEQLKYLKENKYKTLTIQEYVDWYNKKIEVPEKSVLLTIDDGAMGTSKINGNKLIPLLEKYNLNATLFLITSWWDPKNYQSKNLDIQSHGFDLHKIGQCGSQNINCLDYEQLNNDLKKSFEIVNNNNSFCYPFYLENKKAIDILIKLGVQVAFGGGEYSSKRSDYRYYLPRYVIYKDITMNHFINIIK